MDDDEVEEVDRNALRGALGFVPREIEDDDYYEEEDDDEGDEDYVWDNSQRSMSEGDDEVESDTDNTDIEYSTRRTTNTTPTPFLPYHNLVSKNNFLRNTNINTSTTTTTTTTSTLLNAINNPTISPYFAGLSSSSLSANPYIHSMLINNPNLNDILHAYNVNSSNLASSSSFPYAQPPLTPSMDDDSGNELMTIPPTDTHTPITDLNQALINSRDYSIFLYELLEKIQNARAANTQLYKRYEEKLKKGVGITRRPKNEHTIGGIFSVMGIKRVPGSVYFQDQLGKRPPENPEAPRKSFRENSMPTATPKFKRWSKEEISDLAKTIRLQKVAELLKQAQEKYEQSSGGRRGVIDRIKVNEYHTQQSNIKKLTDAELDHITDIQIDWLKCSKMLKCRSAIDCEIQWTNCQDPRINNSDFTKEEDKKLHELAKKYGGYSWDLVARELGNNRTLAQCFKRYQRSLNPEMMRSAWTREEDLKLSEAVRKYGEKNWQTIANFIQGRTGQQCLHRWQKALKPEIKKGRWDVEEDELLQKAVLLEGAGNWVKVKNHVPRRTDVQCRERYVNILNPALVKGKWTEEEDKKLEDIVNSGFLGKWGQVAEKMGSRTDNQCWRRWKQIHKGGKADHYLESLKKMKAVVPSNFGGRKKERPTLTTQDFLEEVEAEASLKTPELKKRGRKPKPTTDKPSKGKRKSTMSDEYDNEFDCNEEEIDLDLNNNNHNESDYGSDENYGSGKKKKTQKVNKKKNEQTTKRTYNKKKTARNNGNEDTEMIPNENTDIVPVLSDDNNNNNNNNNNNKKSPKTTRAKKNNTTNKNKKNNKNNKNNKKKGTRNNNNEDTQTIPNEDASAATVMSDDTNKKGTKATRAKKNANTSKNKKRKTLNNDNEVTVTIPNENTDIVPVLSDDNNINNKKSPKSTRAKKNNTNKNKKTKKSRDSGDAGKKKENNSRSTTNLHSYSCTNSDSASIRRSQRISKLRSDSPPKHLNYNEDIENEDENFAGTSNNTTTTSTSITPQLLIEYNETNSSVQEKKGRDDLDVLVRNINLND